VKFFKLELTSYEDRFRIWFTGSYRLTEEDFGDAVSEAMLEVFRKLEDTVDDSPQVRKDYPLFVLVLKEDTFLRVMENEGFRKLNPDVVLKGNSCSVFWETPRRKEETPRLKDRDNLEECIVSKGVELSDEDPNKLIFGEF